MLPLVGIYCFFYVIVMLLGDIHIHWLFASNSVTGSSILLSLSDLFAFFLNLVEPEV